jgi:archaeoflavoprotein AfpA
LKLFLIKVKRKKIAWGITGSGDRLIETVRIMGAITKKYSDIVAVRVFLSKAGYQVVKYYALMDNLKQTYAKLQVEIDSNTPFLAGAMQVGSFEFMLIAPATSNTVAKISHGIGDTLLCNAALMALKSSNPVYIMPSDLEEGSITTTLPNKKELKLTIRREDVENVRKLAQMTGVSILNTPEDIWRVFREHF